MRFTTWFWIHRHSTDLSSFNGLQEASKSLSAQILLITNDRSRIEADLRIEREWRNALQLKEIDNKDRISKLERQLDQQAEAAKVCALKKILMGNPFKQFIFPEKRKTEERTRATEKEV